MTERAFFSLLAERLEIPISEDALVRGWAAIYGDVMPRSYRAIRTLGRVTPCVALTNTNVTHCPGWRTRYQEELRVFRKVYVSSELGMRKPERRCFEHVLGEWDVQPTHTVFFDDRPGNLVGARVLGIETVLVTSDATVPSWVAAYTGSRQGGANGY
jgi:putative hydrolase of the HAD superfamily